MFAGNSNRLCQEVDSEPLRSDDFPTVNIQQQSLECPPQSPSLTPEFTMTESRTPVRAKVVRMIGLYVYLDQIGKARSISGWLAINDSRVLREAKSIDLEEMTAPEVLDAIANAIMRRAVYAPATPRRFFSNSGEPLHAVCQAVVPVVRSRTKLRPRSAESRARTWMIDVSAALCRIPRDSGNALKEVGEIKLDLIVVRNRLQACRTAVQRLRSGGRNATSLRRQKEAEVAELRSQEADLSNRLKSLVREKKYTAGLDLLWLECSKTLEDEEYFFGKRR